MKISDLFKDNKVLPKGTALDIRVPSRLQEKLGATTKGEFAGLAPKEEGKRIQLVFVKINGKKHTLRPQDLALAVES